MKILLPIFLLIQITLISCGGNTNTKETETESTANIDTVTKPKYSEDEQNKVFDDIKFGMTEAEYKKIEKKVLKKYATKNDGVSDLYFIGDYQFSNFSAEFHKNSLYSFWITGDYVHYDDYKSEIISQSDILVSILTKKYGEPTSYSGVPEWFRTEKDYTYLIASWKVGKKTIEVRLANRNLYCSVDLSVYLPDVVESIEQAEKDKTEKNSEAAKNAL